MAGAPGIEPGNAGIKIPLWATRSNKSQPKTIALSVTYGSLEVDMSGDNWSVVGTHCAKFVLNFRHNEQKIILSNETAGPPVE
jgi:hypothetical protein